MVLPGTLHRRIGRAAMRSAVLHREPPGERGWLASGMVWNEHLQDMPPLSKV
jgi:hypothetical protein